MILFLHKDSSSHAADDRITILPTTAAAMNAVSSSDAIITFAKMLLIMATDVPLGSIGATDDNKCKESKRANNKYNNEIYYKNALINFSIDLMCFDTSEYHVAAKHLLDLGKVMEAIFVCTNGLQQQQQQQQRSSSPMRSNNNVNNFESHHHHMNHIYHHSSSCKGTEAVDFFKAAIDCATKMTDIGDRSKLFYYLYTFFCQYDPESITLQNNSASMSEDLLSRDYADGVKSSAISEKTFINESANNQNSDNLNNVQNVSADLINAHDDDISITAQDINNKSVDSNVEKLLDVSSPQPKSSAVVPSRVEENSDSQGNIKKGNDSSLQNSSPLATSMPDFPDQLFGGKGNSTSNIIRKMFGFPSIES